MVLQSGIIKLSITLYYRRIFVIGAGVFFDWINRAAIAIVVLWTAGFFLIAVFPCGAKFYAAWSDLGAYCQVSFDVTSSFIISDLITDVLVLCLPLPIVSPRSTGVFTKKKIAELIDMDPSNVDQEKTYSHWHFCDWCGVRGHLERFQLTALAEPSTVPSLLL